MNAPADIGLVGLAVMGQNLVLNMDDHGYRVAVFNRTIEKVDEFLAGPAAGTNVVGTHSLEELARSLKRPRRVMLMVKAGEAVDGTIAQLLPFLDPGDIVIDGGNSNFEDSIRRERELRDRGLLFVGTGISGGEEGARHGPSIMPGGSAEAWPEVREIFQAIAAKVDDGTPCCDWVGEGGAGHYVKMVHNGIEYGDMQLIAEAYDLLRSIAGLSHDELHTVFDQWNSGKLDSYLIEITRDIMAFRAEDGEPLVEKVLDTAGQKGTGKWTAISALELGMPMTLVAEAVFARILSALKDERVAAAEVLGARCSRRRQRRRIRRGRARCPLRLQDRLLRAGLHALPRGGRRVWMEPQLRRDRAHVARRLHHQIGVPREDQGCVRPRSGSREPPGRHLFPRRGRRGRGRAGVDRSPPPWARAYPCPRTRSALAFFDGYRRARLPANLIQAQRDYFGAHTYERIDRPRGQFFHTNWTGHGGETSSSTYNA